MTTSNQHNLFPHQQAVMEESYYSGPNPNPSLRAFVADRCVQTQPIQPKTLPTSQIVKKTGSLYDVHSYWSKKPYLAIERFIKHYTHAGDLVLDPFCGCGSTLQAAAGLGRVGIGIDLSPSATHITANTMLYVNPDAFCAEAAKVMSDVQQIVATLYQLNVSGRDVVISSLIQSESIRCIKCLKSFPFVKEGSADGHECCPFCDEPFSTRSNKTEFGPSSVSAFETRVSYDARRGTMVWLQRQPALKKQIALPEDLLEKATTIRRRLNFPVPQRLIDFGGRLTTSGSKTLGLLFEDRALITLFALRERIMTVKSPLIRAKLMLVFTSIVKNCSKMYRFHEGGGGSPIGAYYVPPVRKELNPLFAFREKVNATLLSLREIESWGQYYYLVSTQSSKSLDIPSNTIDYVFTDPPYADTMPFGALNFIWDAWLSSPDWKWMNEEAIGENWRKGLYRTFREVHRVLKPSGFCSVCYHDTSEGTWMDLLDLMAEAGFKAVVGRDVLYIETTQRAYQQTVADKVVKRDHVINFQRIDPKIQIQISVKAQENQSSFRELADNLLRDILSETPGITKDRIYDALTARLIQVGRVEPHDFDALLSLLAVQGGEDRALWYLKDQTPSLDAAESVREDAAAEKIRTFLAKNLSQHPETEGVHYSDIFEHYVYAVNDKPRRLLADWLLDYFYKTDFGTYRPPASEEEEQLKAEARAKGVNRRIKRFVAYLESAVPIPASERPNELTLAEWIRNCKRSGLYEEGKLLYEKGGLQINNLSEELQVGVEEDYQVCVRMLGRTDAPSAKGPKGKRKKSK